MTANVVIGSWKTFTLSLWRKQMSSAASRVGISSTLSEIFESAH